MGWLQQHKMRQASLCMPLRQEFVTLAGTWGAVVTALELVLHVLDQNRFLMRQKIPTSTLHRSATPAPGWDAIAPMGSVFRAGLHIRMLHLRLRLWPNKLRMVNML